MLSTLYLVLCLFFGAWCVDDFGRKSAEELITEACYENYNELCAKSRDLIEEFEVMSGTPVHQREAQWYKDCQHIARLAREMEKENVIVAENYDEEYHMGDIKIRRYKSVAGQQGEFNFGQPLPVECPEKPRVHAANQDMSEDIDAEAGQFLRRHPGHH